MNDNDAPRVDLQYPTGHRAEVAAQLATARNGLSAVADLALALGTAILAARLDGHDDADIAEAAGLSVETVRHLADERN